jgi:hypothetical protein
MAREIFLVADPAGTNIPAPPLNPDALSDDITIINGGSPAIMRAVMPAAAIAILMTVRVRISIATVLVGDNGT